MRFGLFKGTLIVATYAVAYATFKQLVGLNWLGYALATMSGTSMSLLVVLLRKKDIPAVLATGAGSLGGWLFGVSCLSMVILGQWYGYDHGFGERKSSEIAGAIVGSVLGGLAGSLIYRRFAQSK